MFFIFSDAFQQNTFKSLEQKIRQDLKKEIIFDHKFKNMRFFVFALFLGLFFTTTFNANGYNLSQYQGNAVADTIKSDTAKSDTLSKLDAMNKQMEYVIKYFPLPVVSYSSTTEWLFGLTKINTFRIAADQNDTTIQPSSITALAYMTQNKQYKFVVTSNLMFGQNKYESFTQFLLINFPILYFGIGNNTNADINCVLDSRNIGFVQSFKYNFHDNWYVGAKYRFDYYTKIDTIGECELCNEDVVNLTDNEGIQSGFGFSISRETRDNRFNAQKGSYINFEFMTYVNWLGSNFSYRSFSLDLRKYVTPVEWLTIAGQFYTEAKFGEVPVQSLALMGGSDRMRGIYYGRFRDKTIIEAQLELRFPIAWIIGGTIFTGIGEVAPDINAYTLQGLKWTYGVGLRMMVSESTRTNMRFDLGFYDGRSQFFFTFSEAF